MDKTTRTLVLLVLITSLVPTSGLEAAVGDHRWSEGWNAGGYAAPDHVGHIAAVGSFYGDIDLGGGVFTPANLFGGDIFLARFDDDGNHVWSRQITPGGFGFLVQAVAAAPDGSIYVAGTLQNGDIDFGGGVLSGNQEIVLAALEPDGSHRWSLLVGPGSIRGLDASNGTVACTGYTYGSVDFGGGTMNSAGGADIFLGVLDADGTHRYSALYGDVSNQGGMGVAVDGGEGVVLAATTESALDFGGGVLTPTGVDLCLVSFDAVGMHRWSWNRAGDFNPGSGILAQLDLDISSTGTIALAGQFQGSTDLGGGSLSADGSDDVFLALYDDTGAHLSSQRYGGPSSDGAQAVCWDGNGNLALSGTFLSAMADFGGAPLAHSGGFGSDWFVTVFDDAGTHLYSKAFTGNGQWEMRAGYTSSEDLLLFGSGGGNTDFGGGALTDTGFFLAALEGEGGTATAAPPSRTGVSLAQNSPNPFNPRTVIGFRLDRAAPTRLEVYDAAGRRLRTLWSGPLSAGEHEFVFDGRDAQGRRLASGVYRYRLLSGGTTRLRSMILLK